MSISEKLTVVAENTSKVYESGKNDGYEMVKSEVEDALSNFYTKEESDALLDVHKVWKENIQLTGDELEGKKTSDYIYLANITPNNTVVFGQKCEVTSQFFGYVGVQNIPAGRYLLVVEVDVETNFDVEKIDIFEFYDNGSGMVATGRKLGRLTNGVENRIVCEIDFAENDLNRGFFMQSYYGEATVEFTLNDVRLYGAKEISSVPESETGVKSSKDDMLSGGVAVKPKEDFSEDYIIIVDSDFSNPRIYSLDDETTANISMYNLLEDSFALKSIVNLKNLTYEDHILPGEKVYLEQGCLYWLRGNTKDMEFNWYDQDGNPLLDGGGNIIPSFDKAMLFTAGNTHNGYYKNIAIVPKIRTLEVKGTDGTVIGTVDMPHFTTRSFDISPDKMNFYVQGTSSTLDLWKIKA